VSSKVTWLRQVGPLLGILWLAFLAQDVSEPFGPRTPAPGNGRKLSATEKKDQAFLKRLFSEDGRDREAAATEFAALAVERRVLLAPALEARFTDPVWGNTAARYLGLCGSAVLPFVAKTLDRPYPPLRKRALEVVSVMAFDRKDLAALTPILRRGLLDADAFVRQEAAGKASSYPELALALVGPITGALRRTVAQCAEMTPEEDASSEKDRAMSLRYARLDLVRALALCGPAARAAVPALLEALRQCAPSSPLGDEICHSDSIAALGQIHADAGRAAPALVETLGEPCCAEAATAALASFGDGAVPYLAATVHSTNAFVRAKAAEALARLGTPKASSALATLAAGETARTELERQAATRPRSLQQALAPILPTPQNPLGLTDVWSQSVRLPGGQEVLIAAYRRGDAEALNSFGPQRPDLLRVFFKTQEGYREVFAQVESATRAEYAVSEFSRAGRSFLHLVRRAEDNRRYHDGPVWRLDRVFEVTGRSFVPVLLQPSTTACGSWLPRLDETETLGVVIDFGNRWRFGWHQKATLAGDGEAQKPTKTQWLGELSLAEDGKGLAISRCDPPFRVASIASGRRSE
jgi:HEAT repeat protein